MIEDNSLRYDTCFESLDLQKFLPIEDYSWKNNFEVIHFFFFTLKFSIIFFSSLPISNRSSYEDFVWSFVKNNFEIIFRIIRDQSILISLKFSLLLSILKFSTILFGTIITCCILNWNDRSIHGCRF